MNSDNTVATKSERNNLDPSLSEIDPQAIVPPVDLQMNQGKLSPVSPRGTFLLLTLSVDVSSPLPPMSEDGAVLQSFPMSRPGSLGYQDFPSLLRNPSSFMGEGAIRNSFSRNASSNFQIPVGFSLFQHNASYDGAFFPDVPPNYLSPDMTMFPPQSVIYRVRWICFFSRAAALSAHDESSRLDLAGADRGVEASAIFHASPAEETRAKDERRDGRGLRVDATQPAGRGVSPGADGERERRELQERDVGFVCVVDGRRKKDKKDPKKWTEQEDEQLRKAVKEFGEKQWKEIAERIPGRNHVQCLQRWKKVLKPGLKKGHWTPEEDNLLIMYKENGGNWAEVAEHIPGRTAKQCRERWCNHINPDIRKGDWSVVEDNIIVSLQKQWGNRWSAIAEVALRGSGDVAIARSF